MMDSDAPVERPRKPSDIVMDFIAILILISPIYGCFFPFESYVSLPSKIGAEGYTALPFPVTTVSLIIIMMIAAFFVWKTVQTGNRFRHDFLAYGLIAVAFLSALWAFDPVMSIQRAARLMPFTIFAIIFPQLYGPAKILRLMTVAFLVSVILSILVCILEPGMGVGRIGGAYDLAWRGAMIQKNLTGIMFAIGAVVTYAAWRMNGVSLPLAAVTALGCVFIVIMSQSGTAAASLAQAIAVIAFMTMIQRAKMETRILLILLAILSLAMLGLLAYAVSDLLFGMAGRDATLTGRTDVWEIAIRTLEAHPIRGFGYAFWTADNPARNSIWRQLGYAVGHSHNSWLDLWLQLGLAGLGIMIAIVVRNIYHTLRLILTTRHPLGPAIMGLVILLLVRSMTEVQYTDPFPSILYFPLWADMCVVLVLASGATRVPRPRQPYQVGVLRTS
ncbi:O-antigen ligase family protein [Sphingobium sp. CCH11-B1]|jgi:O-antigen ligase|uniref:O-antigen ligase family protein n=1 Tax=Sphingobium sp. CCH11-B1 TaxID=1768781 RepID=UPI00082CA22D|nr:O-antigen ligase family protein [Sphingobium sp. CCH11-B1]MEA3389276.1 O-antigen ligase family protein [Pseudomonadota bacterium]